MKSKGNIQAIKNGNTGLATFADSPMANSQLRSSKVFR